jgi:hypothetical protein
MTALGAVPLSPIKRTTSKEAAGSGNALSSEGHQRPVSPALLKAYGQIPLAFEANRGQTDSRVQFLARIGGSTLFLGHGEAVIASPDKQPLRLKLHGIDANAKIEAIDQQSGKSNYFIGKDPSKWRRNVPQFAKVKYAGVYPGIDLVFYGNHSELEYDFIVAPGADPTQIALDVEGPVPALDKSGDLVAGDARFHKPMIYQLSDDGRRAIDGGYSLQDGRRAGFTVGEYDKSRELVIDPVLSYSTYLGGSDQDIGGGIAVDSTGSVYVTGEAISPDFPNTPGVYQTAYKGLGDIFVTKFSPAGNSLVYSTYLGGTGQEHSSDTISPGIHQGIAVDASGNVYVVGDTASTDFPTMSAFQPTCNAWSSGSCYTAFLSKLSADGSQLLYSTYLGGSGADDVIGVALDSSGYAYLAGETGSPDFPTTPNSMYPTLPVGCPGGGFLSKFDTTASGAASLLYSTYFESYYAETASLECQLHIYGIAVGPTGHPLLAGTWAVGVPENGYNTGFAAELDLSQNGLAALVGSYNIGVFAYPASIAADTAGNAYVTGAIQGCFGVNPPYQCTVGGFQPTLAGVQDAFVAKLNLTTGSVAYLSYLGGNSSNTNNQGGNGIAVDALGNAYVTGYTDATDFPALNPIQTVLPGATSFGFLTKVDPTGQSLLYSTLFGGNSITSAVGVALDTSGGAYITGYTSGTGLPVIQPYQAVPINPSETTFVAKISDVHSPGIAFAPGGLNFGQIPVGTASSLPITLIAAGDQNLSLSSIGTTGDFKETNNCPAPVLAASNCTLTVTFTPTVPGTRTGSVTVHDTAAGSPHSLALTGVGVGPAVTVAPTTLGFGHEVQGVTSTGQTVTLTNTGNSYLLINSIAASGDFAQTSTCPINPQQLQVGSNCSITVTFTPKATGHRTGTLTISDDATVPTQTVALSGTGTNYTFALTPSSATVTHGHASSSVATIAPVSGFTETVDLACTHPAVVGLSCTATPATVAITGPAETSAISLKTTKKTPPGTYKFVVKSTSGTLAHNATFTLTVQ